MKKALAIASLLLAPLFVSAVLEFDQTEIVNNPGLMDQKAEAVFVFTNSGTEAVTVMDPTSSCGCTVPKLEKKEYQPGESDEIRAVFTFGSRVGTQTKRITLRTTSPTVETHLLTMVTHIPEWVKIEPRVLRWKIDEPISTREIRLSVPGDQQVELTLPAEESRYFETELIEQAEGEYTLRITPNSLADKATEFLRLSAKIKEGGVSQSRSFGVHCLVR